VGHANTAAFRNAYRDAQHDSHQQLSDIARRLQVSRQSSRQTATER
jgi:hypothetical protein